MSHEWDGDDYRAEAGRQRDAIRAEFPSLVQVGFECRIGWYSILREFFAAVQDAVPQGDEGRFVLRQVKEKLGVLKIHWTYATETGSGVLARKMKPDVARVREELDMATYLAECRADTTCEICGALGRPVTRHGWLGTRCVEHADGSVPDGRWRVAQRVFGNRAWRFDPGLDDLVEVPVRTVAGMLEARAADVGEVIEHAAIGSLDGIENADGWPGWQDPILPKKRGVVLPWAAARRLLDYVQRRTPRNGHRVGMHPVYAWTPTRLLVVVERLGEVEVVALPRDPRDLTPRFL